MFGCVPSVAIHEIDHLPLGLISDIGFLRAFEQRFHDMDRDPETVEEDELTEAIREAEEGYIERYVRALISGHSG